LKMFLSSPVPSGGMRVELPEEWCAWGKLAAYPTTRWAAGSTGLKGRKAMSGGPKAGRHFLAGVCALALAASLLAVWWVVSRRPPTSTVRREPVPALPQAHVVPPGLSKAEFYRRDLVPLLDRTRERDLASAEQAIERLHLEFNRFRTGIPAFVEDL